jgi:hypothetical protein
LVLRRLKKERFISRTKESVDNNKNKTYRKDKKKEERKIAVSQRVILADKTCYFLTRNLTSFSFLFFLRYFFVRHSVNIRTVLGK